MAVSSRRKGADVERAVVHLHHDAGIPCEKISRTGYTGPDLCVADTWLAEVKARRSGEGFAVLERWLEGVALLFLKRNRHPPLVVMAWETYVALLHGQAPERDF